MTHVRRPNRRRLPGMVAAVEGSVCLTTGKLRYADRGSADRARAELARRDPSPDALEVYRHADCGDWHIGHSR